MKAAQCCPGCGAILSEDRLAGICPACAWRELSEPELLEEEVVALPAPEVLLALPGHEVIGELARGGMSVVYRARQLDPRREVALKMLLPHQLLSPEMCERFRVEIQAIASLDHPAILPLYQVGDRAGMAFYTMKLAAGGSLAARRDQYRCQFRAVAELIATLAGAVQFAHERGVLHRDLKPGNVLFDEAGRPFVSDFGLAKIVTTDSDLTLSTTMLGTPSYLAPEVAARSARQATTASDVYALGAMLYELLAGRPPFQADGITALLKQIVEEEPEPPSRKERGLQPASTAELVSSELARSSPLPDAKRPEGRAPIPRDLEIICLKCLAKEPSRRYESAGALAEDLRRWLAGEAIHARSVSAPEKLWLWARRHRGTAAALGLAVVLLLALVAGLTLSALRIAASGREALRTIEALETQKANDLLADGSTAEGIALLARRVRQHPENWADSARLMWALHQRRWAVPVYAPYRPAATLRSEDREIDPAFIGGDDQPLLAVVAGTNLVIRDLAAGINLHEWPLPFAPKRVRILPSGLVELTDPMDRAWTCDALTGRLIEPSFTAPFHPGTSNLSIAVCGQMAFVVAPDYSGRLVNLQTGSSKVLVPAGSAETRVSHLPIAEFFQGCRLAYSDGGRIVRVVEGATGEPVGPTFTASQRVFGYVFSPDGRVIVTLTADGSQFWDLESGREILVRPELGVGFAPGSFRPGGGSRFYLAGNLSGLVKFDVLTGRLSQLPARGNLLPGYSYSDAGGRFVFVTFAQCVGVFDAETGEPLCEPVAHNPSQKGDGRFVQDRFLTLGRDGLTVLWEVKTNRAGPLVLRQAGALQAARFSPDGRRVVTASHDGTAQVWDARTGQRVGPPLVHRDKVWSACFSPDGRRVATASWDASARIWDAASGAPLSPPLRASNYVFHVEFSPDGSRLLASGEDGVVRLYDVQTGQLVRALPRQGQVYWAHFSPDGRTIVMSPWQENPKLWDVETGELRRELSEPSWRRIDEGVVTRGDFSPDGQWLALGSPLRHATVWQLPEGRLHAVLNHAAVVRTARFSPDARTILTTADDLTARLWDARTGKALSPPLAGRRSTGVRANSSQSLRAGVIHPDGRRAVTGGSDAILRLWDLRNGLSLGEAEFNGSIMDAEFSPDGQRLLVACFDGSAHILSLPPLVDRAPDWLAPLAEALVYQRFDAKGAAENLSPVPLWEACERLRRAPPDDPGVRWARDLLGM